MTGVEVLAAQEVAIAHVFNWTACWIAFFLILALAIGVSILMFVYRRPAPDILTCIVAGVVFGCMMGSLCGSGLEIETEYETQYKVIISDEVPMNDFVKKYEIISQEGRIYTVRVK